MEIILTEENFEKEVINSEVPVLVDFWADWCGPCKTMLPIIEEISNERRDIKVGKVNVDEQPGLARKYKVMSIPYIALFKNGEIVDKSVGAVEKQTLLNMFN